MCRAPSMLSAKIVAQKPAGSWSPAVSHPRCEAPPVTRPIWAFADDVTHATNSNIRLIIVELAGRVGS
jgi:hypothetical protein